MKTLKFVVLILTMLIISSCKDKDEDEIPIPSSVYLNVTVYNTLGGPFCFQELLLSFQSKSGKDLVKGIKFWGPGGTYGANYDIKTGGKTDAWGIVKKEVYTMERIYEDIDLDKSNFPIGLRKGKPFSKNYPELNGNYDYLYFQTDGRGSGNVISSEYPFYDEGYPFREKATFKLTCPYMFGDNKVHIIDTWWKPGEDTYVKNEKIPGTWCPICYRIEVDGKEITEIAYIYDKPFTTSEKFNGPYSIAMIVLDR